MKCKRLIALILLCVVTLALAVPAAAAGLGSGETMSGAEENTEVLRQLGILAGFDGEPAAQVTRAEFCVMVIRTMGREDEISLHSSRTIFRDVTATHWARGYINLAASITVGGGTGSRLVSGVGTGQFKPDSPINYAQAVTILVRMLGYGDDKAGAIWPNGYMNLAASLGLTEGLSVPTFGSITRAQAAVLIGNALRADTSGGETYYKTIKGVASTRRAVILDVDAQSGGTGGLLRIYDPSGGTGTVEDLRQVNPISAGFVGYSGQLLLNSAGRVVGFLPEGLSGKTAALTAATSAEVTAAAVHDIAAGAVIIVGETVYDWANTGYLQASRYLGSTVWLFCDDVGDVTCVYLPVEDPAREAELAAASAQEVIILDTDAVDGLASGRLMAYVTAEKKVRFFEQAVSLAAQLEGKTGQLLLNDRGKAVGLIPDNGAAEVVALQAASVSALRDTKAAHDLAGDAVIIVGETVYDWKATGYLQANSYLGNTAWLFRDGDKVSHVYLPAVDADRAAELAVTDTQTAIILNTGAGDGQLMVYAVAEAGASVEYFYQAAAISAAYEGQIGELLLNDDGDVVGFLPSTEAVREVTVASAKRSGIVDAEGVTHRIAGSAAVIVGDAAYTWKDTGYIQIGSHSGKTVRLYYDDKGSVAYVCLFSGGTSAETEVIVAETVTAAGELARRLGITGSYSITKNGAAAESGDLAQYDVAYFDAVSRTLRASDRQFTGYIESAYPNMMEAETITVSGNEFTVLESAWESLAEHAQGKRVTLLLTDDGKVAAAATNTKIAADMLGVLSADGSSVTLLGSGRKLTPKKITAKENLYGSIVKVSVYQDEVRCSAYTADTAAGKLTISAGMLGEYELAPVCEIYEHTGSGNYKSHVRSLSGKTGEASYDFSEILWTDVIPASAVTAYHLNSAGKVDMILLRDVTGNGYEYGVATKYTGEEGINLGNFAMTAYNSAVTVTNTDGESVKRLCSLYDAKTGIYLGVSAGTYNAEYQRVVSLTVLKEGKDVKNTNFFLSDDVWYAVANEAEIPVSDEVQIYLEATDQWISGEEGLKTVLAMGQTVTVYYDRTVATGGQIRVIVAEK